MIKTHEKKLIGKTKQLKKLPINFRKLDATMC